MAKKKPTPKAKKVKLAAGKKAAKKPAAKARVAKAKKTVTAKKPTAPKAKASKAPSKAKKVTSGVVGKAIKGLKSVAKKALSAAPQKLAEKGKSKKAPRMTVKSRPVAEEDLATAATPTENEEVVLTDAEGRRYCRVRDCDQLANVDSYCRYHYLLFWKRIQVRKKILSEGKLERYIEELTARYPDKFLEMLRKDLRSEKEFLAAIQELEIDESAVDNEFEDETQSYIDEVRGMGGAEPTARDDDDF